MPVVVDEHIGGGGVDLPDLVEARRVRGGPVTCDLVAAFEGVGGTQRGKRKPLFFPPATDVALKAADGRHAVAETRYGERADMVCGQKGILRDGAKNEVFDGGVLRAVECGA